MLFAMLKGILQRLDALCIPYVRFTLALAHAIQQVQPHHAKRNNNEPARTAQPAGVFKAPSPVPPGPKLDRRKLGNQRLKRGPRLSNDELVARGLGEYVRQHTG